MKIKKTHFIILLNLVLTLTSIIYAKKPEKDEQKIQPSKVQLVEYEPSNIEKYIGKDTLSQPLKYSYLSVENYFKKLTDTNDSQKKERVEDDANLLNKSLDKYIEVKYNNHDYADFISQNSTDLITILRSIKTLKLGDQKLSYAYTALKLFNDKLKEAELVDDTMLSKLLYEIPDTINCYFDRKVNSLENSVLILKKALTKYLQKLSAFDHEEFSNLNHKKLNNRFANETSEIIQDFLDQQEEKIRFQQLLVRFLEQAIGKMVWSRTRYESFIPSLIKIGNGLSLLVKHGIIDHADDYDSLLKSLTCRACYFLDLCAWAFPQDFLKELHDHLKFGQIPFLEEEEQDECIKPKKALLTDAIAKCKAKSIAYHREGLMPNYV